MLASNQKICILKLSLLIALACLSASGFAGPLSITNRAMNDGLGPDLGRWRGSVNVSGLSPSGGNSYSAIVEWAAFAPGRFALYLNDEGLAGPDPSGGTDVVYAYQVTSVIGAVPGISSLTVGIGALDARGFVVAPASVSAGVGTVLPNGGGDAGTSMGWTFTTNPLNVGEVSGLLVFTSPFAPELDNISLRAGAAIGFVIDGVASPSTRTVPDIVPEPTSLLMGLVACCGALLTRRSR